MRTLSEFEWRGFLYGSIAVLVSICVFMAFRRFFAPRSLARSPFRISFSAGSFLVAAFTITAIASQQAASTSTYIEVVKWSQIASLVGQASLLLLVARLTRAIYPSAVAALIMAYALTAVMHLMSVSGMFVSYFGEIHLYALAGIESFIPLRVPFHLWKLPVDVTNGTALLLVCFACWRQYRRGERVQALLASILVAVVFAENMHDMYFAGSMYLAPFGLVLMLAVYVGSPEEQVLPATGVGTGSAGDASPREKSGSRRESVPRVRGLRYSPWDHSPLIGLMMAMFLVSSAQALAWNGFESVIILLALLGMGQSTIAVLYRAESGAGMRSLAILALGIIALPQVADILHAMSPHIGATFGAAQNLFDGPLRDLVWIVGLLLLLTAFSLSGMEAGEARRRLMHEHRQLLAEAADRRQAELELQASERRFRRLVENSTDLVAILGPDGVIRDVGASVTRILGYAPEVLVGKSVAEFCHPDDLLRLERVLKRVSPARSAVQSIELRIRIPDGTWRVIESISDLQFDPVLDGIIVNARDITERRSMEERLKSARTDERQLIRYNLHDTVGQDLAGLLCMSGSLAMDLQGVSGALADQANAIVEGVQRTMEDVRKAIMGIAPIEMHPRGLEVALGQLAERLCAYHRVDVSFVCEEAMGIDDYGVATQLFQIAQEALTNAVKHAQASKLVVSLSSGRDRVVLTVADDGIGIVEQSGRSTGLGLQTMRSRAAAIGAWLRISGASGKGTQVKCVLIKSLYGDDLSEKGFHDYAV